MATSVTEQDPRILLKEDLDRLLLNGKLNPAEEKTIKSAFDCFHELFCTFQGQGGPDHSVLFEHSKIQSLPPVSQSIIHTASSPSSGQI